MAFEREPGLVSLETMTISAYRFFSVSRNNHFKCTSTVVTSRCISHRIPFAPSCLHIRVLHSDARTHARAYGRTHMHTLPTRLHVVHYSPVPTLFVVVIIVVIVTVVKQRLLTYKYLFEIKTVLHTSGILISYYTYVQTHRCRNTSFTRARRILFVQPVQVYYTLLYNMCNTASTN